MLVYFVCQYMYYRMQKMATSTIHSLAGRKLSSKYHPAIHFKYIISFEGYLLYVSLRYFFWLFFYYSWRRQSQCLHQLDSHVSTLLNMNNPCLPKLSTFACKSWSRVCILEYRFSLDWQCWCWSQILFVIQWLRGGFTQLGNVSLSCRERRAALTSRTDAYFF